MNVSVTQENLAKALQAASRVTTSKSGLPILNNILIRTDNNRLLVAATNLEIASTNYIGAKVIKDGSITIPARLASEFVSSLPKGQVDLKADGTRLHINSGNYKSTLNGIESGEFPELPTIDEKTSIHYSVGVQLFKQAIAQTVFAASNDSTRPILTGVYWHSEGGKLHLAATDGYRLAERVLMDTKSELAAIVPSSTLHEVTRSINDSTEEIDILFDETQVRFRIDEAEITSRLIDGKYPDYKKLIPTSHEVEVEMPHGEFTRITKIAGLFARESGNSVTLKVDEDTQKLSIQSIASEVGENMSDVDAKVKGSGQVSLNSRYLSEALSVTEGDTIEFKFNGKLAPCVIESAKSQSDYKHIIMPLKS